jgi:hypothetical protein
MRYLLIILLPISLSAQELQTDNLITNGTFESGNSNGWTTNGDVQVIGDCCGSQYDLEFGDSGSIEQDFKLYSDTITQPMLNNGITLDSSVLVQNGEGGAGGWAPNRGGADSFSIRLQIKDSESNVLSETTQTRTTTTNINGQTFTDSVSYTGTGSRTGNIKISGTDANAPARLGGPNVDNISVTMTYDPIVLSLAQTQAITEIFEEIEEVFAQEELTQIEELVFEEIFLEPMVIEETYVEIIEEMPELTIEEQFIEETIVLAPVMLEEEIIEESIEIVEEPIMEETIVESVVETEIMQEESIEVAEEVFEEIIEVSELPSEEISNEESESISETETETESAETQEETNTESAEEETPNTNNDRNTQIAINVQDIVIKVADKIKTIDGQLKATQMIVAKVMQNNSKISAYSNINQDIFIQPQLETIDIGTYTNNTYVDIRNIYPNQTYEDKLWTSRQ